MKPIKIKINKINPLNYSKYFIKPKDFDGNFIEKSNAQVSETLKQFKNNSKNELDRFRENTDTDFFVCVCFLNYKQKQDFMLALGYEKDENYIDGLELSRNLDIKISESSWKPIPVKKHKLTTDVEII